MMEAATATAWPTWGFSCWYCGSMVAGVCVCVILIIILSRSRGERAASTQRQSAIGMAIQSQINCNRRIVIL